MNRLGLIFLITIIINACGMSNNDDNKMKDPYLWLEDVEGKEALQWVESQNELTKERYSQAETFGTSTLVIGN